MTGLAIAGIVLVVVWIAVLTLTVLLLIRQIGLLTMRLDLNVQGASMYPARDGLELGATIPESVIAELPQLAKDTHYIVTLSASCTPCRHLAAALRDLDFPYRNSVIALVPGAEELADDVEAALPSGIQIIRDPTAAQIARGLEVDYTPFAIGIEEGQVTGKSYLHQAPDLVRLIEFGQTADPITHTRLILAGQEDGRDGD